jgi:glucose-1-phosphate adenylyltransferase
MGVARYERCSDLPHLMNRLSYSSPLSRSTLALVLAGGRGSRLLELTEHRAKPAVYFGGKKRIIDFALSNALNSGIRRIAVATQYAGHSLIRHLQHGWSFLQSMRNESLDILPASQGGGQAGYAGTADAVFQNLALIDRHGLEYIVILAGDHVYKMDYEKMLIQHENDGADVTVGCIEIPVSLAPSMGVMDVDGADHIIRFAEKPAQPAEIPGRPGWTLASMGIYVFRRDFLEEQLRRDAAEPSSTHDFGRDLIPYIVEHGKAVTHRFSHSCVRSENEREAYWRDVGTLDAYWSANIDLTDVVPQLDLYDRDWPIWTYAKMTPPAKFVHDIDGRRGSCVSSLVSGGCIVSGSFLRHALLCDDVHVHSFGHITHSILLPFVDVGQRAQLSKVIVDAGVRVPEGLVVGEDPALDASRFRRTENGVCLITQAMIDRLGT